MWCVAAFRAVDEHVDKDTIAVGVGSGSTVVYAVQRLAERFHSENLDFVCVPSSFQVIFTFAPTKNSF